MDRLTNREHKKLALLIGTSCSYSHMSYDCQLKEGNELLKSALNKLAMYEDLEEQGRLLKLPCNVGDKLYYLDENNPDGKEIIKCNVTGFKHNKWGIEYVIGDYYDKGEGVTYELGIRPSEIGVNAFYNEAEAYAKLDLRVTVGQTLYIISPYGEINEAKVESIDSHYFNALISDMRYDDYPYYLDIKVRYYEDIEKDIPGTTTFRPMDFDDEIIFTSREKVEEKLDELRGVKDEIER